MVFRKHRTIIWFIALFFILWTCAWLLHILLANTIWPALHKSGGSDLVFWAVMKVLVWIVFPEGYVRKKIRPEDERVFLGLQNAKRGIVYGLGVGLVWVAVSYLLHGQAFLNVTFSITFLWVITGTPIAEEFTFRGVILPGFQEQGMKFWPANIITSLLFLLVHCLGWAFQGVLSANLFSLTAGSILLLSLACGWLRQRSESLYSSVILHSINNLFSAVS